MTMSDGLWTRRDILVENNDHMKEMNSRDIYMFKVPEL